MNGSRDIALLLVTKAANFLTVEFRTNLPTVQVEIVVNGFAIGSRTFNTGDEALAWAAEEQRAFQADADQLDGV